MASRRALTCCLALASALGGFAADVAAPLSVDGEVTECARKLGVGVAAIGGNDAALGAGTTAAAAAVVVVVDAAGTTARARTDPEPSE